MPSILHITVYFFTFDFMSYIKHERKKNYETKREVELNTPTHRYNKQTNINRKSAFYSIAIVLSSILCFTRGELLTR